MKPLAPKGYYITMTNIELFCAAAEAAFGALALAVCSLGFIIGVNEVLRGGR